MNNPFGLSASNTIGRLVSKWTGNYPPWSVWTAFSYDTVGRVTTKWDCLYSSPATNCAPVVTGTSQYDLAGDLTSSTNGLGQTLTYNWNRAQRVTSVSTNATGFGTAGPLFGSTSNPAHYNAAGSVMSATLGNGIAETRTYDGRLRLSGIADGSIYNVTIPTSGGYAPDSDILAANDSVNGNWTYGYDAFNRLASASATGQAYTYAYDRFGNRWQQNGPHSSQPGFDANNRMIPGLGVTYDAAGDTASDGTTTYTYDAEGRIVKAVNPTSGTSTYVYDADGKRVEKTTAAGGTVDFLYDVAGHEIAQINSSSAWTRGEVYVGDRHLATLNNNTTYYNHADWLGTERARSTSTGTLFETCTSLPFGDRLTCAGGDPSPMHFTGKEHDTETGLDNFGARYDSSQYGRFMTPDWSAKPMSVPYATFANPQSLNLYAYVQNNPTTSKDPDGHWCLFGKWGTTCQPPPPPPPPSANTVVANIYRTRQVLTALGTVGNAAQTVASSTKVEVGASATAGNTTVDANGKASGDLDLPQVGLSADIGVKIEKPGDKPVGSAGVAVNKHLGVDANVVRGQDGKLGVDGFTLHIGVGTPGLPVHASTPPASADDDWRWVLRADPSTRPII